MNVCIPRVLAALLIAVPLLGRADDRANEWIAKARARCGDEASLNAVSSLHYSGTLEALEKVPAKDDPAKTEERLVKLGVEIIFQKPYQHRIVLRPEGDKGVEITALDDYDAWTRRTEAGKEDQFTLYDASRIKRFRANTWENLAFYRGIEKQGGRVEFLGDSDVDGTLCVALEFIHSDEITFTRYFDKATGRLVKTVTDNKSEIREEGEIIVSGIRFPQKLINRLPDGQVRTIIFESIKVNEDIPESQFAVPSFPAR